MTPEDEQEEESIEDVEAAMKSASRLSGFTDAELFDEFSRRYPDVVLIVHTPGVGRQWRYAGNDWVCWGMTRLTANALGKKL